MSTSVRRVKAKLARLLDERHAAKETSKQAKQDYDTSRKNAAAKLRPVTTKYKEQVDALTSAEAVIERLRRKIQRDYYKTEDEIYREPHKLDKFSRQAANRLKAACFAIDEARQQLRDTQVQLRNAVPKKCPHCRGILPVKAAKQ